MKQKELIKQVVPLDLDRLEVQEGELLFATGGVGLFINRWQWLWLY